MSDGISKTSRSEVDLSPSSVILRARPWVEMLHRQSQFGDHLRQRLALDELHRVVVHAAFAADAVDRDDVRVVQARRRLGFVLEALQLPRVHRRGEGQHLERDAAVQRNLLGLVDDAHAAAADFADQAEVAERAVEGVAVAVGRARDDLVGLRQVAEGGQGRQQVAEFVGELADGRAATADRSTASPCWSFAVNSSTSRARAGSSER